jgi:hypothetical protein
MLLVGSAVKLFTVVVPVLVLSIYSPILPDTVTCADAIAAVATNSVASAIFFIVFPLKNKYQMILRF